MFNKKGEKNALPEGELSPPPATEIFWEDLWGFIYFALCKDIGKLNVECLKIQVQKRENEQRIKACLPGKQSGEELFLSQTQ